MARDTQIFSGSNESGSKDYTLPGNSELLLLAVNANFVDNGAGTNWSPAVVLFSDSGHVIARACDPSVQVTAGDDAEVSWFPGVKNSGSGGSGVTGIAAGYFWGSTGAAPMIPSGVPTTLDFDIWAEAVGSVAAVTFTTGGGGEASDFIAVPPFVHVQLTVEFLTAASYDRYIEINQAPFNNSPQLQKPVRASASTSPAGDTLSVSAVIGGSPNPNSPLNMVVYQNSGAAVQIRRYCLIVGWPLPLPSRVYT